MQTQEDIENKPEHTKAKKPIYYIQKEGEYTLSFYPHKIAYHNEYTDEREEIPYESIQEIAIRKRFSFYILIKYFGIFLIGLAIGAITVAAITGSYSNSYSLPCLSSSVLLFILGIFMIFISKERLVLEIKGDRDFLIDFPEKDLSRIEDIVYLVRNRTLKRAIKEERNKGIIIRNRNLKIKKDEGIIDILSILEENEKIKFDLGGIKGTKMLFTDKRLIHYDGKHIYPIKYEEISEIKKESTPKASENILWLFVILLLADVILSFTEILYIGEICILSLVIIIILAVLNVYYYLTLIDLQASSRNSKTPQRVWIINILIKNNLI